VSVEAKQGKKVDTKCGRNMYPEGRRAEKKNEAK
jgi:hypothetical protein